MTINELCAANSNGEPFTGREFPCNASIIDVVIFSIISSCIGLVMIFCLKRHLFRKKSSPLSGSIEKELEMNNISNQIKSGSISFLTTEYKYLSIFVVIVFSILLIVYSLKPPSGDVLDGIRYSACFLGGAFLSGLTGWQGMGVATDTNVLIAKQAAAAVAAEGTGSSEGNDDDDDNNNNFKREGGGAGLSAALHIAFTGGSVMGFTVVSLGLFGLSLFYFFISIGYDSNDDEADTAVNNLQTVTDTLVGFGFGASSIALFARVAGGIYTKAADIGADLVGKIEMDIPEDDLRNPAVIADLVGDNVGDVAGMGADLFESFVGSIIAAIALANGDIALIMLPLWIAGSGIIASILGYFTVGAKDGASQKQLLFALHKGVMASSILVLIFSAIIVSQLFPGREKDGWKIFGCIFVGLISGVLIGQATEYFTSYEYYPTQSIIRASVTGPATVIIQGLGVGMISCIFPVLIIVGTILICDALAGNYGVAMAAVGMLSTLGLTLSADAFGPIADNAGGIAEMAGLDHAVRNTTDRLDALGNTTAATGKGFAIGSAVLTALSLLTAFTDAANIDDVNIKDPIVLSGALLGAMLPFLFAALTMISVQKAAGAMIVEVRRQFDEIPGLRDGTAEADHNRCIAISTQSSVQEMILPGLYAVLSPITVGFLIGPKCLTGLLGGSITSGMMLAIMMANAGGAWDNSKKYIELEGAHGGKGTDIHKACVVGDTVGDPFKDTSGPALNILIKLMSIIALTIAPLLQGRDDWEDFWVGLIPLFILIIGTYIVIKLFWSETPRRADIGDTTSSNIAGSVDYDNPESEIEAARFT